MNDNSFLETLASTLHDNASVKTVFGEPIRAGEKVIIPVAQVMLGMGGGYGPGKQPKKQLLLPDPARKTASDKPETTAEGTGGGGGMRVLPLGVYEITPTRTRFIPARSLTQVIVGLVAGFLLTQVISSQRRSLKKLL